MKTFYFQLTQDNIITDVIEYPFSDYVEVQIQSNQLPLPVGINAGWYRWNSTTLRYALDEALRNLKDIEIAKAVQEAEDALLEDMLLRGALK